MLWHVHLVYSSPIPRSGGLSEVYVTATISGEFNSQEEANTMWVAKGRKPKKRMKGQLERRAE
jgi:hypothetical protein